MIMHVHVVPRLCNGATSFFLLPPFPFSSTPFGVRFDGPVLLTTDIEQNEAVFENCVTRTLPPALTLEEGLEKIKEALQMLKASPSLSSTGFLRFQVAVPPSPKALSWFFCQPESSGVFPLIFVSKNMDNPTFKALHVNGSRGVFGIGTAVSFAHSYPGQQSLIRRENLIDAEYQLRFLIHVMERVDIGGFLSLLKGSFSYWIWNELGILPSSIFPSVRCGLEMAILNAIADAKGSNMLNILHPPINEKDKCESSLEVQICALIYSDASPTEVANVAATLLEEGFSAIKLKVAHRGNPVQDAILIQEVRKKIGGQIIIRADANRKWTYEEAMEFSSLVKDCNLQYIEEPVQNEDDIVKFCEESGLPVALDETIDKIQENPLEKLAKFTHPGIVAVVIKPSVIGGFENAAFIAQWAHRLGKVAVVSMVVKIEI